MRAAAEARGLSWIERESSKPGTAGLLDALRDLDGAHVVNLRSHVDAESRPMLFRGSAAVLANSAHEPFGLVGLETMAAGNTLYESLGGGEYRDVAAERGVENAQWAWGGVFFDFDNDGDRDLHVVNGMASHPDPRSKRVPDN